jgi:phenylalanyl-tRNA synthetase beta subunit
MKVPVEWLNEYLGITKSSKELSDAFTTIGLLLDKPFTQYNFNEYKTDVLDLEHRMDRADWLSVLGCARDVAAYFNTRVKYPASFNETLSKVPEGLKINIKVDCPDLVNRFTTVVISNAKVKASPDWLKNRLEAYGIPSINNVVDVTNYVMVEYGQPMHAQDIKKMRAKEIYIRRAKKEESIKTFLGETMDLDDTMFVLTQDNTPTVIGGIVGGAETGVDFSTTDIILDAGNYNQVNVRQTSRKLKIQNETVLRYDKFLHPALTQVAIERAVYLLTELTEGTAFFNEDYVSQQANLSTKTMQLRKSRLDLLSGQNFNLEQAANILKNLEYSVESQTSSELLLKVPYFRTDVDVEDDIVADVLRIYGYDKVKPLALTGLIPQEITPKILKFEDAIRDAAVNAGLNEYITSPFVEASDNENEIKLVNTINQGMNALRTSLVQTLGVNLQSYINNKIPTNGIFEIGTVFLRMAQNDQQWDESRQFQVIAFPQTTALETAQHTKNLLKTIMDALGLSYSIKNEDGRFIIYNSDQILGEISADSFYLRTEELLGIPAKNLAIKERVRHAKIRDITLLADNPSLGEALYYIGNTYPNLLKIEVNNIYHDINTNKRTISISLFFDELVLDAENAKNDILKVLNERYGIVSINLA